MKNTNNEQRVHEIISKCWEDAEFKASLVSDPERTLEKFLGKELNIPNGKKVVIVDQTDDSDTIYFNLPAKPNVDEIELTPEQIEMVSGGVLPFILAMGVGYSIVKTF